MSEEQFIAELQDLIEKHGRADMFAMVVRSAGRWALYSGFDKESSSRMLLSRFLDDTEGTGAVCRN